MALSYARQGRNVLAALFALDATLERIALGTRDPVVAQMRLAWWREALAAPVAAAQPIARVLESIADRAALTGLVDAWERVLDTPDPVAFAQERGALFDLAARAIGACDPVATAGQGWALADLSVRTVDPGLAARASALAAPLLREAAARHWSRDGRALGALVHLARIDLAYGRDRAGTRRVARLGWHRLTGR